MKEVLAAAAIVLTFAMFVPYIRSIHQGRTKPHAFSWIIWSLGTLIVFFAQLAARGGLGAWPIGVSGLITAYIAVLAYQRHSDRSITKTDWVFLAVAVAAVPCWFLTSNPLAAVLLLTAVDLAGFGPTFRAAYASPHDERIGLYALGVARNGLAIGALQEYSVTTVLFPAAVGIACAAFVAMVAYRRARFARQGARMTRPHWNANTHYHGLVLASLPAGISRVLDVGCGDGILTAQLFASGVPHVVGLDIDRPVLERARKRHEGMAIEWMHGDVLDAPFEPGSFDAVVSVAALHHMDAARALACFAELVRPGGAVVVIGLAADAWPGLPLAAVGLTARLALGFVHGHWEHSAPMCWPPPLTYREMKALSERVLPGVHYRRHWLSRYSLVWRKPHAQT